MFSVQKINSSHEIYINYNEYLNEKEDESTIAIEHYIYEGDIKEYKGTIDLITVKDLTESEVEKLKEIHDILKSVSIVGLDVISDNKKILKRVKKIIPDASVKLFKID